MRVTQTRWWTGRDAESPRATGNWAPGVRSPWNSMAAWSVTRGRHAQRLEVERLELQW